jgi:hypothetical protein
VKPTNSSICNKAANPETGHKSVAIPPPGVAFLSRRKYFFAQLKANPLSAVQPLKLARLVGDGGAG